MAGTPNSISSFMEGITVLENKHIDWITKLGNEDILDKCYKFVNFLLLGLHL